MTTLYTMTRSRLDCIRLSGVHLTDYVLYANIFFNAYDAHFILIDWILHNRFSNNRLIPTFCLEILKDKQILRAGKRALSRLSWIIEYFNLSKE